jgi:hypothetical protein
MGEILRAVMDATALYSNPAFYAGSLTTPQDGPLPLQLGRRQAVFQMKADTWFLIMGWVQDTAVGLTSAQYTNAVSPTTFLIQDMKTSETYGSGQIMKSNGGASLNQIISLPEYILLPPAVLVGLIMDVPITNINAPSRQTSYVTFAGIEYMMPPGKG